MRGEDAATEGTCRPRKAEKDRVNARILIMATRPGLRIGQCFVSGCVFCSGFAKLRVAAWPVSRYHRLNLRCIVPFNGQPTNPILLKLRRKLVTRFDILILVILTRNGNKGVKRTLRKM